MRLVVTWLVAAALTLSLADGRASAQGGPTQYILPDSYYVTSECKRLTTLYADVTSLAGAHRVIAQACTAYHGDGDAWFAAISAARDEVDGYNADPQLHEAITLIPTEAVPIKMNRPYVLFLAPDYAWVKANGSNLSFLHDAFSTFGNALGGQGLAIWFSGNGDPAAVDVSRSARYCTTVFHFGSRYHLSLNTGPYVVITGTRPDRWATANDVVVIKLAGISQARTVALLNDIEQQLLENGKINRGSMLFSEVESRLATMAEQHPGFLKAVAMFIFKGVPTSEGK